MGRSHVVDLTILRDEVAQYLCSQVRLLRLKRWLERLLGDLLFL